jgi:sporulation protein YunB
MNKFMFRRKKKKTLIISMVILLVLGIIDFRLRPMIKNVAANRAHTISTNAINEAVLKELDDSGLKYSDFVKIERSETGKILALTTDSKLINRLKSRISIAIQDKLSRSEINKISIPLGTLLGAEFCSGMGPLVPLNISISGSVVTEFESKFCDAGINQTKHQIYLNIHTKIGALVPGYSTATDVNTNINIAETIIVGEVPNMYSVGNMLNARSLNDETYVKKANN